MPVSVMRLTNINKGIIKLLPQIVTLIILITAIPQLAKLTWRVVFPVSPEDISALPLTMPPAADPELKNVRPAFTLFGLAVKNSPTPTDAASLNQVPVSSLKLRLAGLLASSNPAAFHAEDGSGYQFLVEMLTELNQRNPQVASRLIEPLIRLKRYDEKRQALMRAALEQLKGLENLSGDLFEKISKALAYRSHNPGLWRALRPVRVTR